MSVLHVLVVRCGLLVVLAGPVAAESMTRQELESEAEYWEIKAQEMQLLKKKLCYGDRRFVESVADLRDGGHEKKSMLERAEYRFSEVSSMNEADKKQKLDLIKLVCDSPMLSKGELGEFVYNNCLVRNHISDKN
ncbi:hypothetical protein NVV94_08400 [Pseudomonas sp. LS1212]|uniref:hypothetical protein n=1 Tax=Pseudomonas sp. LS1212 TaxID=2972478 RepID=UPI00215D0D07|nr:hypothetical protein [Pseudomonas sp. LS1212]UVJ45563.1 hypothetical protein NVV94_08400 [Pseudomonas sp. LS1212]